MNVTVKKEKHVISWVCGCLTRHRIWFEK